MRAWIIGYLLGTLVSALSPWLSPPWLCAVLLFACALVRLPWPWRTLACGVLVAVMIASLRGQAMLRARLDPACNRVPLSVSGQVVSLPRVTWIRESERRQRFEFHVERVSPEACGGARKVLLSYYGQRDILPGSQHRFQVRLRRPWGLANPGSFNMQAWFALSGIDAVGSVRGDGELIAPAAADYSQSHHRLRQRISAAIVAAELPARASAVLRALTVADKSGIDHALWTLFQQYGLNHLLVISGLHVAMVAALAFLLGRLVLVVIPRGLIAAVRWPLPELLALGSALAYAALAGFSVATLRALVMLACFLVARMTGRASGGVNNLVLAAWLLMLLNPLVVVGSGFWLSFTAVAGLLWMARWQARAGPIGRLLRPHLFMALLMVPLGGLWFGGSSWVAAPANLLMVPLVGFVVVPLALLGAVLSFIDTELAVSCWQLAAMPLELLYIPAQAMADQRQLFLSLSPGGLALGLAAVAACVAVLPLSRWQCLLVPVLLLPLLLGRPASGEGPRLDVLDTGQGTAVVFSASGRALLYDTGGGEPGGPNIANSVVLPWLRLSAIHALQTLVISHDDLDHSAGALDILDAMAVEQVLVGESLLPGARACRTGLAWQWPGAIRFRVLSPGGAEAGNEASCVLLIDTPDLRILLAGDIGVAQERELIRYWGPQLRSDVLLVGHHGSATSTSQAWLNHVAPQLAVVTAGYASRFGHPHNDVLARLAGQGISVRETAREGALTIRRGRLGELQVAAHRDGYRPWWM